MEKELGFAFLPAPAQRALQNAGILTFEELNRFTREELLDLHGFGPKGMRLLEGKMADLKIEFKK
ncbi:MAG: hypothetical protein AB9921_08300 [Erysipelotrichaceae bacterium]